MFRIIVLNIFLRGFNMIKQCAIEIELILCAINPQREIGCQDIEFCPYKAIFNTLNGRSDKLLQRFVMYYEPIEN